MGGNPILVSSFLFICLFVFVPHNSFSNLLSLVVNKFGGMCLCGRTFVLVVLVCVVVESFSLALVVSL